MKKNFLTLLATLSLYTFATAQVQTQVLDASNVHIERMERPTQNNNTRRGAAGPSWFEPSEAIRNTMGGNENNYTAWTIFPDTNAFIGYVSSTDPSGVVYNRTFSNSLGVVFDPRSYVYSPFNYGPFQSSVWNEIQIDSLRFQGFYRRFHENDSVVDTLVVTTFRRESITRHFTSILFCAVDYTRNEYTAGGPSAIKQYIPLTINDTSSGLISFALPVNRKIDANAMGFNWFGASVTFIPGKRDYPEAEPHDTIADFVNPLSPGKGKSIFRLISYLDESQFVEDPNNQTFDQNKAGERIYNHGIVAEKNQRYAIPVGTPPQVLNYFYPATYTTFNLIPGIDFLASTQNLSVKDLNGLGYGLGKAYPNPTNGANQFTIPFDLGQSSNVTLTLSDITGKVVRTIDGKFDAGDNYIEIGTDGLNSGIYIYNMTAGSFKGTGKVIVK